MPLLLDSRQGSWLWRDRRPQQHSGRSQPDAERVRQRHSDFWLLASISWKDIKGDSPCLVRNLCELMLRHFGFDPIIAVNGIDGLQVYNERHEEICLVLSDVAMPKMGGIEMVRRLFETHSHPNVIMMSGNNLSDLIPAEVKKLCSVIEKPFAADQLITAVKKCLDYEAEHHPSPSQ